MDFLEKVELAENIKDALGGKYDGSRKNILANCPFCGKTGGKFGVYIGKETLNKIPFMWNCFSCRASGRSLFPLLDQIGRLDLLPEKTTNIQEGVRIDDEFAVDISDHHEYEMVEVEMPNKYSQTFNLPYLKRRGFRYRDYRYFEAGITPPTNTEFYGYVIFPIKENGKNVGYVSRHTWDKRDIDEHNRTNFNKIYRYKNSKEEDGNDFQHLLYNIDAVIEGETRTVILVEGIFDVIALTRKLNLYKATDIAVCATFGKQISDTKMLKLQERGVESVVIGYDGDAVEYVAGAAETLDEYFDVLIADIPYPDKDWDDLDRKEIYDIFTNNLKTPIEYNLKRLKI